MDIINDSVIEKKLKSIEPKKGYVFVRWGLLLLIIPIFLIVSDKPFLYVRFWFVFAFASVYNVVFSILYLKSKLAGKNFGFIFYADILLVSIFSYFLGGLQSDIYVLLFFIIAYYGTSRDVSSITKISIFTIITYCVLSLLSEGGNLAGFNFLKLAIRGMFIIFTAYGISSIIIQVKIYDEMHKREFKRARTDKLTGLANRHYFDQKLEEEALYAEYSGKPLNVLMFDIDNFKVYNDSYGHIEGDKLLSLFGNIILQSIRKTDIPVRYGGEEFIILIRDLDLEMAKNVGDRIRNQLEKENMSLENKKDSVKVTVSCGIAQFPKHSDNIKKVVEYADKALYHAKRTGKNKVVCYDEVLQLEHELEVNKAKTS
ncbi:GGDEF domain-containing protein [Acetivibrio saccincola]|uniref:GGDEF domain-containing protein n=1 Tax=Acetivibrio saccincola TaxID=1677857 RepID=A0A2K9E820_9FIRM|nr:diguanylate cyclase [Acetivibrio saccincola]AUG57686.1 putative diguanylate cyclase YcdT [Acetivibrio saccincola]PQQ67579.1 GGDEF domain-containing protein [Acetivibrio saccincola]